VWWHVLVIVVVSTAFEALFVAHGLNPLDEGWPLYAAMRMHEGGVLYRDVFFVFPPGHLLPAWLAYEVAPPGVVLARSFYAAFNVALCVALYALGRRLMPPLAALLAALLLAVGAPHSHAAHYLFGYRYLFFSVAALWCFSERLRRDDARWMCAAGALAGLALLFRLTPAIAVAAGIGAGVLASSRSASRWWGDAWRFAAGLAALVVPVAAWFATEASWAALWNEVVVRPIEMTAQQSLPLPPLGWPARHDRWGLRELFVNLQFRLYALLFASYAFSFGVRWLRALRAGRTCGSPLWVAVVVWGGVYFMRAFGRADEAHLDSTLPAACLLLAHVWSLVLRGPLARLRENRAEVAVAFVGALSLWVFLTNADLFARYPSVRGHIPVEVLGGRTAVTADNRYRAFDALVRTLRAESAEGDSVLDLSASSLLHVVSGRTGPGGRDIVMPGTFDTPESVQRFLARLEARPPALVIAPRWDFDERPERALAHYAPALDAWVRARYRPFRVVGDFVVLRPE